MKGIFTNWLNSIGLAYWVQVDTQAPTCTYYFGPFRSQSQAEAAASGYVQDLEGENAQNIKTVVKRCKPEKLTIIDEAEDVENLASVKMIGSRV